MIRFSKPNKKTTVIFKNPSIPKTKQKGQKHIIMVALDTCVVIDMAYIYHNLDINRVNPKKKSYYFALKKMLDRNVLSKKRKDADLCLCITPEVDMELKKFKSKYYGKVKNFVERFLVCLEIDAEKENHFVSTVNTLVDKYCEKGYFLDCDGNSTVDAINVGQASYFNIYIISNDHHICTYRKDDDPELKIQEIRKINERTLNHSYREIVAVPKRPEQFLTLLNSGRRLARPINLENLRYLKHEKILNVCNFAK